MIAISVSTEELFYVHANEGGRYTSNLETLIIQYTVCLLLVQNITVIFTFLLYTADIFCEK